MIAPQQFAVGAERAGAATAAGGGMWLWLAENQQAIATLGVLVGIAVGLVGLAVNWYYLHRDDKRRNRRSGDKS